MHQLLARQLLSCCLQPGAATATAAAAAAAAVTHCSAHAQRCWASTSTSSCSSSSAAPASHSTGTSAAADADLTPEQQQHRDALRYLVSRPLAAAHNAALLTGLAASYRDLYVVMDQFHKRDILGIPRPLLDEPPEQQQAQQDPLVQQQQQPSVASLSAQVQQQAAAAQAAHAAPAAVNHTQMFLPVRDLTKLPDEVPPEGGWLRHHLQDKYMDRYTAYAQLLPNHMEVSWHTGAFILLWPPMEAYYPMLLDTRMATRYLAPHLKAGRGPKRSRRNAKVRCALGWRKRTPYHKQRVFGAPHVPPNLML